MTNVFVMMMDMMMYMNGMLMCKFCHAKNSKSLSVSASI